MDWKYKHFEREAVFQAGREPVLEAARAFLAEALADWKISETADGLEARGYSAFHEATAKFRIEPALGGTKVAVTLLVERASALGFMLVDVGGFYDGQVRKWLAGIQVYLHQGPASASQPESVEQRKQAVHNSMRAERLFGGCLLAVILLAVSIYFLAAVVGLLTGNLFLAGRGEGSTMIHGPWARILSAIMLALMGWVALRLWKPKKRNRGSEWLPPP